MRNRIIVLKTERENITMLTRPEPTTATTVAELPSTITPRYSGRYQDNALTRGGLYGLLMGFNAIPVCYWPTPTEYIGVAFISGGKT